MVTRSGKLLSWDLLSEMKVWGGRVKQCMIRDLVLFTVGYKLWYNFSLSLFFFK